MILSCEICHELISSSEDVRVTSCGHLFHANCVLQWLNSGHQSCPHCRRICSERNLLRVFLTSVNEDTVHLDKNCIATEIKENLEISTASLNSLKIDFDQKCNENQELQLKLISIQEFQNKEIEKIKNENNELCLKLASALDHNTKKEKELQELTGNLVSIEHSILNSTNLQSDCESNTLNLLNLKLEKKDEELNAAKNEITHLKCIQDALILQNTNNKGKIINYDDMKENQQNNNSKNLNMHNHHFHRRNGNRESDPKESLEEGTHNTPTNLNWRKPTRVHGKNSYPKYVRTPKIYPHKSDIMADSSSQSTHTFTDLTTFGDEPW